MPSSNDRQARAGRSKRRNVRVEAERRAQIDHRKLGRALLRLAQADYEREQAAKLEADSAPPTAPDGGSPDRGQQTPERPH